MHLAALIDELSRVGSDASSLLYGRKGKGRSKKKKTSHVKKRKMAKRSSKMSSNSPAELLVDSSDLSGGTFFGAPRHHHIGSDGLSAGTSQLTEQ